MYNDCSQYYIRVGNSGSLWLRAVFFVDIEFRQSHYIEVKQGGIFYGTENVIWAGFWADWQY